MRDGRVDLVFVGDERPFRLGIDQLLALEDACDAPLADIASRLQMNRWKLRDLIEILRLGLIGGGADPKSAKALVDQAVSPGRILQTVLTARIVLNAALMGEDVEGSDAGKAADAAEAPGGLSASPPASSSETAPSSDTHPKKSDE
jgi:hypothetical protein